MVLRRTARLRGGISRSKTPAGMPRGVGALRRVMKPTPACWIGSLVRQHGKHALFEICISQEICVYCPVRVTVQFRGLPQTSKAKKPFDFGILCLQCFTPAWDHRQTLWHLSIKFHFHNVPLFCYRGTRSEVMEISREHCQMHHKLTPYRATSALHAVKQ